MNVDDALKIADEADMDLVVVNPNSETPICKIMNYSKYLYEQQKKQKQISKGKTEIKEVKFGPTIADHDLEIKAKTASRILNEGDKVKVSITYKGRMMMYISSGVEKLINLEKLISEPHKVDKEPKIEGNRVYMVVSPAVR